MWTVDLLSLLKWKANPERVLDVLGRLRVINGEEIVKVHTHLHTHTQTHDYCTYKTSAYSYLCMAVCSVLLQFLQDVLDTLFSLLDDNIDKYGPLVFQSLVKSVFWLLTVLALDFSAFLLYIIKNI